MRGINIDGSATRAGQIRNTANRTPIAIPPFRNRDTRMSPNMPGRHAVAVVAINRNFDLNLTQDSFQTVSSPVGLFSKEASMTFLVST